MSDDHAKNRSPSENLEVIISATMQAVRTRIEVLEADAESMRIAGERLRGQYNTAVADRDRIQHRADGLQEMLNFRSRILDKELGQWKSRLKCDHPGCENTIGLPVQLGDAKRWLLLDVLDWTEDVDGHHRCHEHSDLVVKDFTGDQDKNT